METVTILVVFTVAVAFGFDVINGFHDAANSIATIVSTRVLRPRYAVFWAAFFNFVAMFVFARGWPTRCPRSWMSSRTTPPTCGLSWRG